MAMTESRQRWFVLIASFGLTGLLVGGFAGGVAVWRNTQSHLQDAEFLHRQLDVVEKAGDDRKAEKAPPPVRVDVARIQPIQPQTSIVGRLIEVRKVTVASETPGKILAMPVEIGTPVTAGKTVLARVDSVWSRLAAERYAAQVAMAQAQLKYQESELQRGLELSKNNAITKSALGSLEAAVAEWTARRQEATAALQEEQERVDRAIVLAPFDGTVVLKHAELGAYVAPGDPLMDIVSRGEVDVRLMVPESVVNRICVDQEMAIHVDPLAEEVRGRVVSVTPYGPTASRTFPVRVRLDDQGGRLKVGMSVTALIATGPERRGLVVHKDAVLIRPDGATVWVADSPDARRVATAHPVPVTISVRAEREYAIELSTEADKRLLHDGTLVVIEGAERLRPELEVRLPEGRTGGTGVAGEASRAGSEVSGDRPAPAAPTAKEG